MTDTLLAFLPAAAAASHAAAAAASSQPHRTPQKGAPEAATVKHSSEQTRVPIKQAGPANQVAGNERDTSAQAGAGERGMVSPQQGGQERKVMEGKPGREGIHVDKQMSHVAGSGTGEAGRQEEVRGPHASVEKAVTAGEVTAAKVIVSEDDMWQRLREVLHSEAQRTTQRTPLPLSLPPLTIISLGRIDTRRAYHSAHHIWPPGYHSVWRGMLQVPLTKSASDGEREEGGGGNGNVQTDGARACHAEREAEQVSGSEGEGVRMGEGEGDVGVITTVVRVSVEAHCEVEEGGEEGPQFRVWSFVDDAILGDYSWMDARRAAPGDANGHEPSTEPQAGVPSESDSEEGVMHFWDSLPSLEAQSPLSDGHRHEAAPVSPPRRTVSGCPSARLGQQGLAGGEAGDDLEVLASTRGEGGAVAATPTGASGPGWQRCRVEGVGASSCAAWSDFVRCLSQECRRLQRTRGSGAGARSVLEGEGGGEGGSAAGAQTRALPTESKAAGTCAEAQGGAVTSPSCGMGTSTGRKELGGTVAQGDGEVMRDRFGFEREMVARLIEGLAGASECEGYVFVEEREWRGRRRKEEEEVKIGEGGEVEGRKQAELRQEGGEKEGGKCGEAGQRHPRQWPVDSSFMRPLPLGPHSGLSAPHTLMLLQASMRAPCVCSQRLVLLQTGGYPVRFTAEYERIFNYATLPPHDPLIAWHLDPKFASPPPPPPSLPLRRFPLSSRPPVLPHFSPSLTPSASPTSSPPSPPTNPSHSPPLRLLATQRAPPSLLPHEGRRQQQELQVQPWVQPGVLRVQPRVQPV